MRAIRGRILVAMLSCALLTAIGSVIAWPGFVKRERHAVSDTRQAWQTADACMESWVAALSLDRACDRGTHGDLDQSRTQFEWAKQFAKHARARPETTSDIETAAQPRQVPGKIYELTRNCEQMTQRPKRSRKELIAAEPRHRPLFGCARHGVAVRTRDGTIPQANHALSRMARCSREALKGLPVETIAHSPKMPGALVSEVLESLASNPQGMVESELISERTPLPIDIGSVDPPDGRRVVAFRDRPQPRGMQQALIQSEKMRAAGQLATSVAHELHNPLFATSDGLYDLNDTVRLGSDGAVESLRIADQQNARARKIIGSLLELSRTAPGTIEVGLDLAVTPPCRCEPDSLKQLLVNMITNVADAMPQGGRLEIATDQAGAGRARFTVTDTGEETPADKRREILNPFYPAKPPDTGTRRGLWIADSTVTRCFGCIDAVGAPGRGTTVTLDFDVAMEQAA